MLETNQQYSPDAQRDFKQLLVEHLVIPEHLKNRSIEALDVSVRLWNVLCSISIVNCDELSSYTYGDIYSVRNCGKSTILELNAVLSSYMPLDRSETEEPSHSAESSISIPEHLRDLPIKFLCVHGPFRSFLLAHGIKTLGGLDGLGNAAIKIMGEVYPEDLNDLIARIGSGEFDKYTVGDQPSDLKNMLVRNLRGTIPVPAAALDVSVAHIPTSTRLANVFAAFCVQKFGDLQRFTFDELKAKENCGKNSIFELWQCLTRFSLAANEEFGRTSHENLTSNLSLAGLLELINQYLSKISSRDQMILVDRLGGRSGEESRTLEELGSELGITRERVRQIESKHLRRLQNQIADRDNELFSQLIFECESIICPLTPRLLASKIGTEYSVFQLPPEFYLNVLKELCPELPILSETRSIPQQRVDRVQPLVREIMSALQEVNSFETLAEVWTQIFDRRLLEELGMTAFFDALQADDFQIIAGDSPSTLLIGIKKLRLTSTEMARAVLFDSAVPLTPEQILERIVEKYGSDVTLPSPNSLANIPGYDPTFFLLGPRCIGLRRHFRLPEALWNRVQDDCYGILRDRGRPVSTYEIFSESGFDWTKDSTTNELAAIIREDDRFVDLGRLLFSLAEWRVSKREPINHLISKVLAESNRPLRTPEIAERVRLHRSFSATSLPTILRDHPDIEEIGVGYYGLKARGPNSEFVTSDKAFLTRVVRRCGPISFDLLCEKLSLSTGSSARLELFASLKTIPEIRLSTSSDTDATLITFVRRPRGK